MIKLNEAGDSIEIVNANLPDPETPRIVQLKATTKGGVEAFKQIKLMSLLVCGAEKVDVTPEVAIFELDKGDDNSEFYTITDEVLKTYFSLDATADGASDKCVITKLALVDTVPDYVTYEAGVGLKIDVARTKS